MHYIHAGLELGLQGKNTQIYPMTGLSIYCSMDKQYVEGLQNGKKAYLISLGNIDMWLYHSLVESETTSLQFKEQRKKIKKAFLLPSCDTLWEPIRHTNYLRKIIINCISTVNRNQISHVQDLESNHN